MSDLITMPAKGERIRQADAITYVTTGFTPFIPLTKQYKWGMMNQAPFVIPGVGGSPKATGKGMGGAGGRWQWVAQADDTAGGAPFQPNIERYNLSKGTPQDLSSKEGYLSKEQTQYPTGVFQTPDAKGRQGGPNALASDLRYTPDNMMRMRSEEMARELGQIIESHNIDAVTTNKDLAEAEEEAILDLMSSDVFPELNNIIKRARTQALTHGSLPSEDRLQGGRGAGATGQRGDLGLSKETYDWSHKDIEDLTKMYAIINTVNEFSLGDKLSNRMIGIEVTKDETKFFALDKEGKIRGEKQMATIVKEEDMDKKRAMFGQQEKVKIQNDINAIMGQIKAYYEGLEGMSEMVGEDIKGFVNIGGVKMQSADTLAGFTQQLISRAQEALLSPRAPGATTGEQNTYGFQYVIGSESIGGPYQVWVEIQPTWSSDKFGNMRISSIPFKFSYVPMTGVGGARMATIANLLLMKVQHMTIQNMKLDTELAVRLEQAASTRVANIIQTAAMRAEQLGAVFHHDLARIMADSFMGFSTVVATMTNKDVADSLGEKLSEAIQNPELKGKIQTIIDASMEDSSKLTDMWKNNVGGNAYTVGKGYVYANAGGPWKGGGLRGEGVGVTPLIGASSELGLVQSLAKKMGSKWRVGGSAKYTAQRLSGNPNLQYPEILYHPEHQKDGQQSWMSKAFEKSTSLDPSKVGYKNYTEDGVIRYRESWFKKYGAARKIKEYVPGQGI